MDLIYEIKLDLFGWYYQLNLIKRRDPKNKEEIERHISGFMETYIVLKRTQGRWKPEWDSRCEYSKIKTLYKLVVD